MNISEAARLRWANPEYRKRRADQRKAFMQTAAGRAMHARMNEARWAGHQKKEFTPEQKRLIIKLVKGGLRKRDATREVMQMSEARS